MLAIFERMEQNASKLQEFVINSHAPRQGVSSLMKTSTTMESPKGSDEALEDLDAWLREFDRVVNHVSSNRGMTAQDRIAHLLGLWPDRSDVGENMRLDMNTPEYLRAEILGDHEECWLILLARLNSYRVDPAEGRRKAEALWNAVHWPGNIQGFHTLLRRAVTAMKRYHQPLADHQIVIKYLELIPSEKARMLEDPLRRPKPNGYNCESIMSTAAELFAIGRAYLDNG